ncbi:MAG TPA: rRNA maturation RNase YbeY [Actinomycetota bacterium]|nr:rRNA maturation RNase YbeY [Actinomycetota bacterium]
MADDDHPVDPGPADGAWPRVLISNRQRGALDEEGLRSLARDTLRGEGVDRAELSVSFVETGEIEELHERFMDEPGPTDVLSFPLEETDGPANDGAKVGASVGDGTRQLGDVVVAPAEAERNNPADPDGEIRLLLVHGILHLLGYDHEEEDGRTRMWERQERYSGVRAP